MKSSSQKSFDAYDFGTEEHLVESVSGKLVEKYGGGLRNPKSDCSPSTKYKFLECFARTTYARERDVSDASCIDVDVRCGNQEQDGHCSSTYDIPEAKCVLKGISGFDESRLTNCIASREQTLSSFDETLPETMLPGRVKTSSFGIDTMSCGEQVSENQLLECSHPGLPSNRGPVDLNSDDDDDNRQTSPQSTHSSEIRENEGSSQDSALDHSPQSWTMENNMAVDVVPDYLIYGDRYCTESLLTFSCSGIKLEGRNACGSKELLCFEWEITEIDEIKSQWFARVETALVNLCIRLTAADVRTEFPYGTSGSALKPSQKADDESKVSIPKEINFDKPFEDVIYPKGDPDAVSISMRDVELLQPETFINDTIIDFYIKYLKNNLKPEELRRFHFFNSFFFRKLADMDKNPSSASEGRAAFLRVRKWTRKVNLFEKDYLFIPINFNYLWEEWKERQTNPSEDASSKFFNLRFIPLELPQQENSFDCGLFLLHYVELFLEEAPACLNPFKITEFCNFLNKDWFPPAEASLKRAHIQNIIYELIEDYSPKMPTAASNECYHSSQCMEDCDREENVELLLETDNTAKECNGTLSYPFPNQGIEIKLLTSYNDTQRVRDPGLVFRELLEPETAEGSSQNGQLQSLDLLNPFCKFKDFLSPVEEGEGEEDEQIAYSPSDGENRDQLAEITADACAPSFTSRSFAIFDSICSPGRSMHGDECQDDDSITETSSFGSQSSLEVRMDECPSDDPLVHLSRLEETEKPSFVLLENAGCNPESSTFMSSKHLEACVIEDSQEDDRNEESEESRDSFSSCQENPPGISNQFVGLDENENSQLQATGSPAEINEERAAKRMKVAHASEGEIAMDEEA
ncbi:hypothetical protein Sjap_022660 [Stephania japonica]|uniref:Ubiquitin-like protease family profile domain-containing protein n=1 Tax=Stephania japonica TaxID=461633 RepID=A0AAP0EWI0_9MAGN